MGHRACLVGWVAVACLSVGLVHAEDLGTYGRAYPIKERDAIDAMKDAVKKKLANGGQEALLKGAKDRYLDSLNNIELPPGIKTVTSNAVRLVDLTQTIDEAVKDHEGKVIVAKGTRINPLAVLPLTKKIFFIDERDSQQVAWVGRTAAPNDKIIVMAGSVLKAGERLKRRTYMDVPGLYKRMQIEKLPSLVSQQDAKLKIQEVKL